jgi:hypothetical protein
MSKFIKKFISPFAMTPEQSFFAPIPNKPITNQQESAVQRRPPTLDEIIKDREDIFGADELREGIKPPRLIQPPSGFVDPYKWWVMATETVIRDKDTDAEFVARGIMGALREHAAPTYFISNEMIDAMEQTDFGNAPMRDIEWSHNGILFMLPERKDSYYEAVMRDPNTGQPLTAQVRAVGIGFANVWSSVENSQGIAVFIVDSAGACSWALIPFMDTWQEAMDYISKRDMMTMDIDEARQKYPWQSKLVDVERGAMFKNCSLIFKVLCLWNSERSDGSSEIVQRGGTLVRAGNPKRNDRKKHDLWSGIVLGLNETVADLGADGEVCDPKVRRHWRRGHFRNQPHGAGRSLRKSIWIRPYMAGSL